MDPRGDSQPTDSPHRALPAGRSRCVRCATVVEVRRAAYTEAGDLACDRCGAAADLAATEDRAVTHMKGVGYGNLGAGLACWFFNPFAAVSIIAIGNAAFVAGSLRRGDWYRRRMGRAFRPVLASAVTGGVLGALAVLSLFGL
jgi:hypothetical protein